MGSTSTVGESKKPEELRGDIERTQREMSETIHEIEYRLSPRTLINQTKESVRRAGVSTSQKFIDKVKENPIPAAMVGVGLWLLMRNSSDDGNTVEFYPSDRLTFDEPSKVDAAKAKASEAVDKAREKASEMRETARQATSRLAMEARSRAFQARTQTRDVLRDTPLVAGIAAIALGAIVAAVIPETQKEDQLLGETRDRLLDRGKELAREGVEKAKHVAQAAKESAKQELRASGTT